MNKSLAITLTISLDNYIKKITNSVEDTPSYELKLLENTFVKEEFDLIEEWYNKKRNMVEIIL